MIYRFQSTCVRTQTNSAQPTSKEKSIDGKKVKYQEKIPISSYATATAEPDQQAGG